MNFLVLTVYTTIWILFYSIWFNTSCMTLVGTKP